MELYVGPEHSTVPVTLRWGQVLIGAFAAGAWADNIWAAVFAFCLLKTLGER